MLKNSPQPVTVMKINQLFMASTLSTVMVCVRENARPNWPLFSDYLRFLQIMADY
jgi:hypothetical protein